MKVTFLKINGKKRKSAIPPAKPKAAPVSFSFLDDQDDLCSVNGVDAAGNAIDISGVATIAVSTDTPGTCTADTVVGTTFQIHGLAPGTANITCTGTWTDGSVGPFIFILPVTVSVDAVVGIVVTPGTPTVRP